MPRRYSIRPWLLRRSECLNCAINPHVAPLPSLHYHRTCSACKWYCQYGDWRQTNWLSVFAVSVSVTNNTLSPILDLSTPIAIVDFSDFGTCESYAASSLWLVGQCSSLHHAANLHLLSVTALKIFWINLFFIVPTYALYYTLKH